MKVTLILFLLTLTAMSGFSQTPSKAETVQLNGSTIYYEIYGRGNPLFLLHGFTQTSQEWHPYIADYSSDFQVYLVDLKGHGKSGPFTEKISLRSVAEEIADLANYLELESIDVIGYSYGAETMFQLALLRPGLIKSMVSIGSCGSWRADDFPNLVEYLSYENIEKLPWMAEQHNDEQQIRSILNEIQNYNVTLSDEELETIQTKTLFVLGDRDDFTSYECVLNAMNHLPNSYLWIIPNTTHSAHTDKNKDEFVRLSKQFLSPGWPE